mgnify:FL=1
MTAQNKRKTPSISRLSRVLIICEGYEEYDYLTAVYNLDVWSDKLEIIIKNARSLDNIAGQYQYEFANGNYDFLMTFCDTEVPPYKQFNLLLTKISSITGKNKVFKHVCFSNPCTMQIILSHFKKVKLESNQKDANSPLIQKLTGVYAYRAHALQRAKIAALITKENYFSMKQNITSLETNYTVKPSTNAIFFFNKLESGKV